MPTPSKFTPEAAARVINALAAGRRAVSIAPAIGVDRTTLYTWRKEDPDFAHQWDVAVHAAGERMEERLYDLAMEGDLQAMRYWLRAYRPAIHDRVALVKLGMLQVTLATLARKGGGGDPPVLEIDQDGLPVISAPMNGGPSMDMLQPVKTMVLPDNGRVGLEPLPPDDGSGRTMPLPRRCMVILDQEDEALSMIADGSPVPGPAVRSLWARVRAYNQLCGLSGQREEKMSRRTEEPPETPLEAVDDGSGDMDASETLDATSEQISGVSAGDFSAPGKEPGEEAIFTRCDAVSDGPEEPAKGQDVAEPSAPIVRGRPELMARNLARWRALAS